MCISQIHLQCWVAGREMRGWDIGKMLHCPPREAAGAVDRMKFQLIP